MKLKTITKLMALIGLLTAPANAAETPPSKIHVYSGYVASFAINGFVPANINQTSITLTVQSDCDTTGLASNFELDFYEPTQVHKLNSSYELYLPSYYQRPIWHIEMPISTMPSIIKFLEDHQCVNTTASASPPSGKDTNAVIAFEYCGDEPDKLEILPNTLELFHRGIHGAPLKPCQTQPDLLCTPPNRSTQNVVPTIIGSPK